MNVLDVALWGGLATLVLTGTMFAAQGLGWSRMSLPFLLGAGFTMDRQRATLIGLAVHLLSGWAFAAVYALAFESLGRAAWWMGVLGGAVHVGIVLTVGMGVIASLHPNMATPEHGPTTTRWLQPPGFLALNYGRRTPLVALVAHLLYGGILGASYHPVHARAAGALERSPTVHVFELSREGGARRWALVCETGEEVVEQVRGFADRAGVQSARFTALGAFRSATLAYFDWERKEYRDIPVEEQVEVTSLIGDVGVDEDGVAVHAHAVLGRHDGSALTGHLVRGTVRPTLELFLDEGAGTLHRRPDPETGLTLLRP